MGKDAFTVMSYNVRCDVLTTLPGESDYWPERSLILSELLKTCDADIIGCQELMKHQREYISGLPCMKNFSYVGEPRDFSSTSESCGIFYRSDKFFLINTGTFWLSDTPREVGSVTWGNECPRIATWAIFGIINACKIFTIINTHFDHVSEESRLKSADALSSVFSKMNTAILMGDFNSVIGSPVYKEFLFNGFSDTINKNEENILGTFNNYKEPLIGDRLDWILTTKNVTVQNTSINTFNINGKYASDHLPVISKLQI